MRAKRLGMISLEGLSSGSREGTEAVSAVVLKVRRAKPSHGGIRAGGQNGWQNKKYTREGGPMKEGTWGPQRVAGTALRCGKERGGPREPRRKSKRGHGWQNIGEKGHAVACCMEGLLGAFGCEIGL